LQVPAYAIAQIAAIIDLVRRRRIDLLNSHWLVPQGFSGAIARQFCPGLTHVVHAHAGDVFMLNRVPGGGALARFVLAHSDAAAASGSHVRDTLDRLIGRRSHAVLQPMGADPEIFAPDAPADSATQAPAEAAQFPDGFLLFYGRLVEKKGAIHLIRAMPQVHQHRPGLGLVVIGSGPLERDLRQEASRLGIAHRVAFLGALPQQRIAQYLRLCRAAVVPSVIDSRGETEGMPTVVLEAMAAGARVIGSAVDGIPDVIGNARNGWLCRPGDPDDLARTILTALDCPDPAPIMQAARQTAAQFDWPSVARRYWALLRDARRKRASPLSAPRDIAPAPGPAHGSTHEAAPWDYSSGEDAGNPC
jgi:glycosyltransferase involved in cell wall biosynthesis